MNYNVANLLWQGITGHKDWPRAWRSPEPKAKYDAVVVGGGGHGLATAYYLAREHGMTNIAVLEKGWIGGGNTGRNTTNVRSDYMFPESAKVYDLALRLYETLGRDLNYNIMLSQRGWLTLIHDQHQMELARHKANWLNCNGVDGEIIDREQVRAMLPGMNIDNNPRFAVRGAFLQKRGGQFGTMPLPGDTPGPQIVWEWISYKVARCRALTWSTVGSLQYQPRAGGSKRTEWVSLLPGTPAKSQKWLGSDSP